MTGIVGAQRENAPRCRSRRRRRYRHRHALISVNRCDRRRGFAELFSTSETIVVFTEMLPDEIAVKIRGRVPADCQPPRPQIAAVDRRVQGRVGGIAVALRPLARHANIQAIIDDRNIDHAFEAAVLIIADVGGRHGLELIRWLGRFQIDHACRRVAPIKRALRTAQHFDLADVVEFLLEEMIADERRVVERNRHRRVGRHRNCLCPDAA